MNYRDIGKNIQKAREEAGLSQAKLAEMIGCTQSSLSNYELGKRRLYLADLKKISDLLGKPIEYFLNNDDDDEQYLEAEEWDVIFREPYIKNIIIDLLRLSISRRKSVLDFIKWQRNEEESR